MGGRKEGNGRRKERKGKGEEKGKGSEREENRKGTNQGEKWEGGEGIQGSGNLIHPCFDFITNSPSQANIQTLRPFFVTCSKKFKQNKKKINFSNVHKLSSLFDSCKAIG